MRNQPLEYCDVLFRPTLLLEIIMVGVRVVLQNAGMKMTANSHCRYEVIQKQSPVGRQVGRHRQFQLMKYIRGVFISTGHKTQYCMLSGELYCVMSSLLFYLEQRGLRREKALEYYRARPNECLFPYVIFNSVRELVLGFTLFVLL